MAYSGLSEDQVLPLQRDFGLNEISHAKRSTILIIFIKQFQSPLIYILLFAGLFSFSLGELAEGIFIFLVVLINTLLGFYQEYRAEHTLESLQSHVPHYVKVIRDGAKRRIEAKYLVPGDIIILESGLKVPGDGYILEATELLSNEAILTGESEAVRKSAMKQTSSEDLDHDSGSPDMKNKHLIFMGTTIVEGLGIARIQKTGKQTMFGKIAQNVTESIDPITPTKRKLKQISAFLTALVIITTIFIVVLGLLRGFSGNDILLTAIALGVSTIPEGLLISFTVVLALGMNRIMKKKAIVKNLPAAETLGSIDVLCIDKTGTLTEGKMSVRDVETTEKAELLKAIAMCNNDANLVDEALKQFAITQMAQSWEETQAKRIQIFPFSSLYKYTGASDGKTLYMIGAPEVVLDSALGDQTQRKIHSLQKASEGMRVIAVALKLTNTKKVSRKDFHDMTFLGFIYIQDPVRESAKTSLQEIQNSGIMLKIITGDLQETTVHILNELKYTIMPDEMVSGKELQQVIQENDFDDLVLKTKLFFRTTPDQKLAIVQSLQRQNLSVGMMGDGVNDAPALKNAEIGISVDNATDVSKEVSDIVLLDTNFQTIVSAIEEGRNIFKNSKKIITYLFADSLSETILIVLSLLANYPLPLLPLHLLWINIIEDGLPSIALGFDKASNSLLDKRHKPLRNGIFDKTVISTIIIISLITDLFYFLFFVYLIEHDYSENYAQTMMFAGISISSLLFLFSAKTIDSNIWKENIFNNKVLNVSLLLGFTLLATALYTPLLQDTLHTTPLKASDLALLTIISLVDIAVVEIVKMIARKYKN